MFTDVKLRAKLVEHVRYHRQLVNEVTAQLAPGRGRSRVLVSGSELRLEPVCRTALGKPGTRPHEFPARSFPPTIISSSVTTLASRATL